MFDFRASVKNGKWKMDDHFPFALENENNGMYTDRTGCLNTVHVFFFSNCQELSKSIHVWVCYL